MRDTATGEKRKNKGQLYAILADIHANYPALKQVAADARRLATKEKLGAPIFVCLGDVVDYGPHPNECMEWISRHATLTIRGNHEREVQDSLYCKPRFGTRQAWWPILLWTRLTLQTGYRAAMGKWPLWQKGPRGLGWFTLFHDSLVGGRRIADDGAAQRNFAALETHYGLFGHTHYQMIYQQAEVNIGKYRYQSRLASKSDVGQWQDLPLERTLFNPGSVGQPRRPDARYLEPDGYKQPADFRAAYMLLHLNGVENRYQFRRVKYPCAQTVADLAGIRWAPNGHGSKNGSNTHHGKRDEPLGTANPGPRISDEYLAEMPHKLDNLVEKWLIPKLSCPEDKE